MRYIYTIGVVTPSVERALRTADYERCERALLALRGTEKVAYFSCQLVPWNGTPDIVLAWIRENRPRAARRWQPLQRRWVVILRQRGDRLLPRPSARELHAWYHHRSVAEDEFRAVIDAIYDALVFHVCIKCPMIVAIRLVGTSLGDRFFLEQRKAELADDGA
jgi:hypothetical protein